MLKKESAIASNFLLIEKPDFTLEIVFVIQVSNLLD